tara:strand:- start:292 stop:789 length:498 start_codon:yes stop_codon:yes gene_type:complete
MSESKSVLAIVCGNQPLKEQVYNNLSITYQTDSIKSESEYLNSMSNTESSSLKDFYCFLPNACDFTNDDSITKMINFFNSNDSIGVAICDNIYQYNGFSSYQYTHPNVLDNNDTAICVRSSVLDAIDFSSEENIFQKCLYNINQKGHIIFHLAEPLFTIKKEGSA